MQFEGIRTVLRHIDHYVLKNSKGWMNHPCSYLAQGCQIGFFVAKFHKFGFFLETVGVKKIVWLFLFNIWLFLEAVRTYYKTCVLAFKYLAEKCY